MVRSEIVNTALEHLGEGEKLELIVKELTDVAGVLKGVVEETKSQMTLSSALDEVNESRLIIKNILDNRNKRR